MQRFHIACTGNLFARPVRLVLYKSHLALNHHCLGSTLLLVYDACYMPSMRSGMHSVCSHISMHTHTHENNYSGRCFVRIPFDAHGRLHVGRHSKGNGKVRPGKSEDGTRLLNFHSGTFFAIMFALCATCLSHIAFHYLILALLPSQTEPYSIFRLAAYPDSTHF